MDSLSLYKQYRINNVSLYNKSEANIKFRQLNEIIKLIHNELTQSLPHDLSNSTFISETINIMEILKRGTKEYFKPNWVYKSIIMVDAFVILKGVYKILKNSDYDVQKDYELYDYGKLLFTDGRYTAEDQIKEEIKNTISMIQSTLKSNISSMEDTIKNTDVSFKNPDQNQKVTADLSKPVGQFQAEIQKTVVTSLNPAMPLPPLSPPASLSAAQNLQMRTTNQQKKERQERIKTWNQKQDEIIQQIHKMQPDVQQLLKNFMSFSETLYNNYIRLFAMNQIDLFNIIDENYKYHKPISQKTESRDYSNAVDNYSTYLEIIIDDLASFGIEGFTTNIGESFDGKFHEVINNKNFSPHTAVIKKSLRSGFKYKDVVLQKELVEI